MEKKAYVVGLDGVLHSAFVRWIERGFFPKTSRIMKGGRDYTLYSTIPPLTLPSWYSMFTGKDPSELDIYGFVEQKEHSGKFSYVKGYEPHKAIWDIIGRNGYKSVVINFPIMKPVELYKGSMVAGMLPPPDKPYTTPSSLTNYIKENIPEYLVDLKSVEFNTNNNRFPEAISSVQAKVKLAKYLINKINPDLLVVVFTETDRLQHVLWKAIESEGRSIFYRKDFLNYVKFLKTLDTAIFEIYREFAGDKVIPSFIVSDHGFGLLCESFFVNRWLMKKGYLVYNDTTKMNKANKLSETFLVADKILKLIKMDKPVYFSANFLNIIGKVEKIKKEVIGNADFVGLGNDVNWDKTTVFHYSLNGGLYFNYDNPNLNDNTMRDIIKNIQKDLMAMDKPKSQLIISNEIYKKKVDSKAPFGFVVSNNYQCEIRSDMNYRLNYLERPGYFLGTGTHRKEGILYTNQKVSPKEGDNFNVTDIFYILYSHILQKLYIQ